MIGLLQRVTEAHVDVDGNRIGSIGPGLLVPQFTLAADTRKGTRPSFTPAAPPEKGEEGRRLLGHLLEYARASHSPVASGEFGAHMRVSLVNDGPVTIWLQVRAQSGQRNLPPETAQADDVMRR